MASLPYQRVAISKLEKPSVTDILQGFSTADRSLRATLLQLLMGRPNRTTNGAVPMTGFIGASFRPLPPASPGMGIILSGGIGFQWAPTDTPSSVAGANSPGLDDLDTYKPIVLSLPMSVAVPTAPGANSRIDIIEVRYNRQLDNPQSVQIFDEDADAFSPSLNPKTLDFCVDSTLAYYTATAVPTTAIAYKSGVVSGSPTAPATDAGYIKVCEINVGTSVTTIDGSSIVDRRPLLGQVCCPFRVLATWTGSAHTFAIDTSLCPPGVDVVVADQASPQKNTFLVYVFGGGFASAVARAQFHSAGADLALLGASNTCRILTSIGPGSTGSVGALFAPLQSAEQTIVAAGTPATKIGVSQERVNFLVDICELNGASTLFLDPSLPGVTGPIDVHIEVDLNYIT